MNRHMYFLYEAAHSLISPSRAVADSMGLFYRNPLNPLAQTAFGRNMAAACELYERLTRRYGKPAFGLHTTEIDGETVPVTESVVWEKPFCRLIRFVRGPHPSASSSPSC
jgi:poly(3-hydroxybutyrate) depolymerase